MAPKPTTASTNAPTTAPTTAPHDEPSYVENWNDYWLELAVTASRKSKDPKCRVGAVIIRDNIVASTGFNGLARDVYDDPVLLSDVEEKLKLICHAEQNAIYNAARHGVALHGASIHVTKFPCLACCNAIIQAGIVEIHTHDNKYWGDDPADKDHSRKKSILKQAKVRVVAPFHPDFAPAKQITGKGTATPAASIPKAVPKLAKSKPKGKKPAPDNMNLFPARRPISGGKSET